MSLTRADLESQLLQKMILEAGLDLQVLTETELKASILETIPLSSL